MRPNCTLHTPTSLCHASHARRPYFTATTNRAGPRPYTVTQVHCTESENGGKATCVAFYDQAASFVSGTGMDYPPMDSITYGEANAIVGEPLNVRHT